MYARNIYVKQIMRFMGKPIIKVITGMRRSGKSCFARCSSKAADSQSCIAG